MGGTHESSIGNMLKGHVGRQEGKRGGSRRGKQFLCSIRSTQFARSSLVQPREQWIRLYPTVKFFFGVCQSTRDQRSWRVFLCFLPATYNHHFSTLPSSPFYPMLFSPPLCAYHFPITPLPYLTPSPFCSRALQRHHTGLPLRVHKYFLNEC